MNEPETNMETSDEHPDRDADLDRELAQLGFSGTQTAKVVGISYRQLDYWARTDLLRPSLSDASGSGSRRRYSYNDLLELKAIKKLLDAGIKLEQVRKVFEYMREHVATDEVAGLADRVDRVAVRLQVAQRVLRGQRAFAEHVERIAVGGVAVLLRTRERLADRAAHHELVAHDLHRLAHGHRRCGGRRRSRDRELGLV